MSSLSISEISNMASQSGDAAPPAALVETRKRKKPTETGAQQVEPATQLPTVAPTKKALQKFETLVLAELRVTQSGHVEQGGVKLPEQELTCGKGNWGSLPFGFQINDSGYKKAPRFISGIGKNADDHLQLAIEVDDELGARLQALDDHLKGLHHDPDLTWSPLMTDGRLRANVILGAEAAPSEQTAMTFVFPNAFDVMERQDVTGWADVKEFAERYRFFKGCPVKAVVRMKRVYKYMGYQGISVRLTQLAVDCNPANRRAVVMPPEERAEAMASDDLF